MDQRRLTSDEFRNVIGHFASGVTVITAVHDERPYGTTASAVTSLSLEPPMMLVCLDRESQTGGVIVEEGRFAVNILGEDQADLAVRFATKAPDKFDGVATTRGEYGEPLLADALATLECRVVEQTTGGTHVVFFGEVETGSARPDAPLAYYRGQFGRMGFDAVLTELEERRDRGASIDELIDALPVDLMQRVGYFGRPEGPEYVESTRRAVEFLKKQFQLAP